ncbi:HdaA/DnaA family protein [Lutimaribacter degradans]|uniref:HdaA/DnaA family protein n=1 Tax=Lutimaribacter degradans TaxID=2945989 RepID=UPI003DA3A5AD
MGQQLGFDLPVRTARAREDFFVSPANAMAVAMIENWQNWPSRKLLLIGPEGAGKTHLAHVWAQDSGARIIVARDLCGADIPALAKAPVAIEDAEDIAGERTAEEALFHLHNLVLAEGHSLLVTATGPAQRWGLRLPDLQSRMQGTQTATLSPPDDRLLGAVLLKLFADRQVAPSPEALNHLLRHMTRDFATARAVVAEIDRVALAEKRPITAPLVRRVLTQMAT